MTLMKVRGQHQKRAILLGPAVRSLKELKQLVHSVGIRSNDFLVGVDGGTQSWFDLGHEPHFAVGDWDSLKTTAKTSVKEILSKVPHVTLSRDKDRSDLFFALISAIEAGVQEVICLGVTGGMPDHHLAVLFDLSLFSTGAFGALNRVQAIGPEARYEFLSSYGIPDWPNSPDSPNSNEALPIGQRVSIFAMEGFAKVSLSGFKYPLKNAILKPCSHGMSNVVKSKRCGVHLLKGQLLVIIPQNGTL